MQFRLLAIHREQLGALASHFRCERRHAIQARGDGLTLDSKWVEVVVIITAAEKRFADKKWHT